MLALSVRQFAEEIMAGTKDEEYRSRRTRVRGRCWVYACLAVDPDKRGLAQGLPRGVLVGTVEVVGCQPDPEGGFIWLLRNPERAERLVRPTRPPQPGFFNPGV